MRNSAAPPVEQRHAALLAILQDGPLPSTIMTTRQRRAMQAGIDALVDYLDAIERDPDLEPYMSRPETGAIHPQRDTSWGGDECEDVGDDEPSLGSLGGRSGAAVATQTQWAGGGRHDLEQDVHDEPHDGDGGDLEPDMGSLEGLDDQRSWAAFARDDEPGLGAPESLSISSDGHRATRAAENSITTSAAASARSGGSSLALSSALAATRKPCFAVRACCRRAHSTGFLSTPSNWALCDEPRPDGRAPR